MKPSVDEQLRESRRILMDEILPAVESDHVADIVRRLGADLRKLGTCWEAAIPFARWEVDALQSVLDALAGRLPEREQRRLARLPAVRLDEVGSYARLCERAEILRSVLSQTLRRMPPPAEAPGQWRVVLDYFGERLGRDPMTNRVSSTDG